MASTSPPPPASRSPPPAVEDQPLDKCHILPLGAETNRQDALDQLNSVLKSLRSERKVIHEGDVFEGKNEQEYIIVSVLPNEGGIIVEPTEFFIEGPPVEKFTKVQLVCTDQNGEDNSEETLFGNYVAPYFQSQFNNHPHKVTEILDVNQILDIFGLKFVVAATEPSCTHGVVTPDTTMYVNVDNSQEFTRIHVVPFQDTLSRVYQYDLWNDYLKPYFKAHPLRSYAVNDVFDYHGVQFKVVAAEPYSSASGFERRRVGRSTTIFCEGSVPPTLRNLLSPEMAQQLQHLPPGLQMLLLNTDMMASGDVYERLMDLQETLSNRTGLDQTTIDRIPLQPSTASREHHQEQCMICLNDFAPSDPPLRVLPCSHVFHANCIDEWLRRNTDCPICKDNVQRSMRNGAPRISPSQ
ncbi:ring finger protein, putative [Perkinsus marinus ATCC 50983]|uniref:Ring finger protein, putative n=1 Tax=Perkinsus marinus (strain ATCC 50983 / TXsc) TaxID=423536 RepID=C5KBD5_PERM5|nr:ring finger protein, putative [Perkinsus marinus ATCC 50983]EER18461.1 ring finger protein, putative [Perkinsus marinus ATCC 50983]|eukprot:XP_002786665.1 ring finger protein, putative [Perkinsus marinus ATCC 50983]